jgi:predicted MPP superfamily phosphohydrolase
LRAAVQAVDDAGVDLVAMTGDLLDDIDQLDGCLDALAATRARHGCLAVMGNHEMWRGHDRVLAAYAARRDAGRLRLLTDESVTLEPGGLRVVGVDWPSRSRRRGRLQPNERRERMQRSAELAFADVRDGETVLCLSHHPDFFPFAARKGADLTLAGHTHGGQVALFGAPVFSFAFDYMLGRFKHALGSDVNSTRQAHLFVGGGMGHWVPYRFGVPAEVTVLTLRRA